MSLLRGVDGRSVGLTVSAESFKSTDNHSLLIVLGGGGRCRRDCMLAWFRHCTERAWVATRLNGLLSDRSVHLAPRGDGRCYGRRYGGRRRCSSERVLRIGAAATGEPAASSTRAA